MSAALIGALLVVIGEDAGVPDTASRGESLGALVEQGRYLATAGNCISCHTRSSGESFSGGRPFDTQFGVIYSANITPDPEFGIGGWSEEQFSRALRKGVSADGKHLYPALPYTAYTKVTDADVRAMYAYFFSLKPVKYAPPKNDMYFPFGLRGLLAGWKMIFFEEGEYVSDPSRSVEWNRGAYLTEGLGHCGACHSPRNMLGGERSSQALTGGTFREEIGYAVVDDKIIPMEEGMVELWSAPNLTSAPVGLDAWSLGEIATYLKTGHSARAGAFGPMNEVIANSTSHLTDPDVRAIAVYLKSLPPAMQASPTMASDEQLAAGEIVYTTRCGDCHLPTGLGVPRVEANDASKAAPPLAGNAVVQAPNPATLINIILYGAHGGDLADGSWPWPKMNGFELAVGLDDEQIAALATYVRSSWGNNASAVDAAAVNRQH